MAECFSEHISISVESQENDLAQSIVFRRNILFPDNDYDDCMKKINIYLSYLGSTIDTSLFPRTAEIKENEFIESIALRVEDNISGEIKIDVETMYV